MDLIELLMRVFYHGPKQGFYLRYLREMNQFLISKNVNSRHRKRNTIQLEWYYGMNLKLQTASHWRHQCMQNKNGCKIMLTVISKNKKKQYS
jgi:hypothetical protein